MLDQTVYYCLLLFHFVLYVSKAQEQTSTPWFNNKLVTLKYFLLVFKFCINRLHLFRASRKRNVLQNKLRFMVLRIVLVSF